MFKHMPQGPELVEHSGVPMIFTDNVVRKVLRLTNQSTFWENCSYKELAIGIKNVKKKESVSKIPCAVGKKHLSFFPDISNMIFTGME